MIQDTQQAGLANVHAVPCTVYRSKVIGLFIFNSTLSPRGRAMRCVTEYFAKSFKVTKSHWNWHPRDGV